MPTRSPAVIKKLLEKIGISTEFIFRPAETDPDRNVFNDWEELISRFERIDATKTIWIDTPEPQTIILPDIERDYDFSGTLLLSTGQAISTLVFPNGARIVNNFFSFISGVNSLWLNTLIKVFESSSPTFNFDLVIERAQIENGGSQPVISLTNAASKFKLDIVNETQIINGGSEVFEVNSSSANINAHLESLIEDNTFSGSGVIIVDRDDSSRVDTTQTGISGSFTSKNIKPIFQVFGSSTQDISSGATFDLDSIDEDNQANVSLVSNEYTIPAGFDGLWMFGINIDIFENVGTAISSLTIQLQVNALNQSLGKIETIPIAGRANLNVSMPQNVVGGDVVKIIISFGGPATIRLEGGAGAENRFWGYKL